MGVYGILEMWERSGWLGEGANVTEKSVCVWGMVFFFVLCGLLCMGICGLFDAVLGVLLLMDCLVERLI